MAMTAKTMRKGYSRSAYPEAALERKYAAMMARKDGENRRLRVATLSRSTVGVGPRLLAPSEANDSKGSPKKG